MYGLGSGRLGPPSFGRDEFAEWLRGWHAKYDTDFPIETRIPLSNSFTAVRRCTTCTAPYRQISTIGRWQCRWVYLFPPATGTVWGPVDHRADGEAEMGNEEDGYVDVPLSAFIMIPKYENLWTRLISLNILRGDIDGHTGTYEGDQAWIRVARRPLDFDPHTVPPGGEDLCRPSVLRNI